MTAPAEHPPPRTVRLVLCDGSGTVVGGAGPYDVELPWWQEVEPVVEAAATDGLSLEVLRLLDGTPAPGWATAGGEVTYLAELRAGTPPASVPPFEAGALEDHPLRQRWARPGGPAAELAWARAALALDGRSPTGGPVQVRTWNLSGLWRLPTDGGACWLKAVPPMFEHEAPLLAWLGRRHPGIAPVVLAAEPGRVLLDHVEGGDRYGAGADLAERVVDLLTAVQVDAVADVDELLALGVADWRWPAWRDEAAAVAGSVAADPAAGLDGEERSALGALVDGLDRRAADLASCGVPDTLVHGDLHTGNVRTGPAGCTLLDWTDGGVGNPLLDVTELVRSVPEEDRALVAGHAAGRWAALVPGCDPHRALRLLAPLAQLRAAVTYARFLAAIEPAERRYHADDVAAGVQRAARAALREPDHDQHSP